MENTTLKNKKEYGQSSLIFLVQLLPNQAASQKQKLSR